MPRRQRLDTRTQSWNRRRHKHSDIPKTGRRCALPVCRTGFVQRTACVRQSAKRLACRAGENFSIIPQRAIVRRPDAPSPYRRPRAAIVPRFSSRLVKAQKILYAALSYPHPTAAPSGLAAG